MNWAILAFGSLTALALADAARGSARGSANIPSKKDMKRYVDVCECYEYAEWMARDFGFRRATGGYFFEGKLRDHAWVVMPDGTILDSTHGQFVPREGIRIAKPGSKKHRVYVEDVHMTEAQLLETYGLP